MQNYEDYIVLHESYSTYIEKFKEKINKAYKGANKTKQIITKFAMALFLAGMAIGGILFGLIWIYDKNPEFVIKSVARAKGLQLSEKLGMADMEKEIITKLHNNDNFMNYMISLKTTKNPIKIRKYLKLLEMEMHKTLTKKEIYYLIASSKKIAKDI